MQLGRTAYELTYAISPIFLVGGIAEEMAGMPLPIAALTQADAFPLGVLAGGSFTDAQKVAIGAAASAVATGSLDKFFAKFDLLSGGTLIENQVATYPFANLTTAANAILSQPNHVSLRMVCPPKQFAGMFTRMAIISGLKDTLDKHNQAGGTYTILTPSYIYRGCVMTRMVDTSPEGIQQTEWTLDFTQPLLAVSDAEMTYSTMIDRLTKGVKQAVPKWTGGASQVMREAQGVIDYGKNVISRLPL